MRINAFGVGSGIPLNPPNLPQVGNLDQIEVEGVEDFGSMMVKALQSVNGMQQDARQMQNDLMSGKPVEFHNLMVEMEKASTAMTLTMQVRNKILEAYQEVARTQI
ncbi:MAG: flagellar hook-basal body complex protein FliE [Fimbriimonadaceae bacterium]|nr:flagellar hook-basal body complex protein FliE [Fimbriimonadaceae bacterium]